MKRNLVTVVIGMLVALGVLSATMFKVDQRESVIVFRLGEIVAVKEAPGLYFKVPMLDQIRSFDRRILTIDTDEPDLFLTSEKKNVLVDSFVKWRIIDVKQYYVSVQGDEERARIRLTQTVNDGLRAEFGKRTIHDVVSGERDKIIDVMREKADSDARKIGVQVLDVRLKRVDLPQEVSESVYGRMQAERQRVAKQLRSLGTEESEKIRADADRQREIIIAEAYRDGQRLRGDGDAKASAIYASAFQTNPEFYSFYRSLDAYRKTFRSKSDLLVIEPNSEFFRYLRNPGSGGGGGGGGSSGGGKKR